MSRLVEIKRTPNQASPDVVTLEEAKEYLRVDFNDDDNIIERLISSSRHRLEEYSGRVFVKSDCSAIYAQQGCGDKILLSFSDNMVIDPASSYASLLVGESYINTEDHEVQFNYTAGYTFNDMPLWMKQVVLMDVAYRYENRGDISANSINCEVKEFLAPYVKWSLI